MKVPIRYKSSDRYNAGVDVVYDDESKLQYAPFIYATTASGDNGGDGEDEEGEDTMVVHVLRDSELSKDKLDKNYAEIKSALQSGKNILCVAESDETIIVYTLSRVEPIEELGSASPVYTVYFIWVPNSHTTNTISFSSDSETGVLVSDAFE